MIKLSHKLLSLYICFLLFPPDTQIVQVRLRNQSARADFCPREDVQLLLDVLTFPSSSFEAGRQAGRPALGDH